MSRLPPILPPSQGNSSPLGSPRSSLPGHLSPYRDSAARFSSSHGNANVAVGSPRASALARDAAASLHYPTSASRPTSPSPDQQTENVKDEVEAESEDPNKDPEPDNVDEGTLTHKAKGEFCWMPIQNYLTHELFSKMVLRVRTPGTLTTVHLRQETTGKLL